MNGLGLGHFLPRDKEPSQSGLSFLPCRGICFSVLDSMWTPFFCLSSYVSGPQAFPQLAVSQPQQGGVLLLPLQQEVGGVVSSGVICWP